MCIFICIKPYVQPAYKKKTWIGQFCSVLPWGLLPRGRAGGGEHAARDGAARGAFSILLLLVLVLSTSTITIMIITTTVIITTITCYYYQTLLIHRMSRKTLITHARDVREFNHAFEHSTPI